MNYTLKEQSLSKALSSKGLAELPKQYRDGSDEYWLEAIVLVRKQNLTQSYCLAKRDADGKISYIDDFGMMSPISGLISIHPYLYLDRSTYMPYENIEQMRHALVQYIGGDEEAKEAVNELPDTEVQYQILQIAIDSQYAGSSINETHQAILDAVGVTPKQTITFENEGQNEETGNNDDAGGVSEPSERSGEEYTGDGDAETDADNGNADFQSEDAVPAENAQVVEPATPEKPKNKGGRPKGSKNTATRRTTNK